MRASTPAATVLDAFLFGEKQRQNEESAHESVLQSHPAQAILTYKAKTRDFCL